MKSSALVILAVACLVVILYSGSATSQSNTLPLGQVDPQIQGVECPAGFFPGTDCYATTVTCRDTLELGFTYGVTNPGGRQGTIVFFNGDEGTTPGFLKYVAAYTPPLNDFQTVQVAWDTAWEDTGNGTGSSLKSAACRPATVMNWLLNQRNVYSGGGMCAQGASAGSAAVAYALTEYGAYQYLNHVELESGPVLSNISTGCNPNSSPLTVCPGDECLTGGQGSWSDSPIYVDNTQVDISTWTGAVGSNACASGDGIGESQYTAWQDMSIVDGLTGWQADTTFVYPTTSISGWLCSKPPGCNSSLCQNNSAAQGQLYYENVITPKSVYRVDACLSVEGVDEGTVPELGNESGLQAIIADMVGQCRTQHR